MKIESKDYLKYKDRSLSWLDKKLWRLFSEFIRKRDADDFGVAKCISCNLQREWKYLGCGHYISRGNKRVKFDERNNNAQCKGCNAFKQGAAQEYRIGLIEKIGLDEVEDLERTAAMGSKKIDRMEYIALIVKYESKRS